jgi:hypothetical protein
MVEEKPWKDTTPVFGVCASCKHTHKQISIEMVIRFPGR